MCHVLTARDPISSFLLSFELIKEHGMLGGGGDDDGDDDNLMCLEFFYYPYTVTPVISKEK